MRGAGMAVPRIGILTGTGSFMRSPRILILLLVIATPGCLGSDDGPDPFRLCGNGGIDTGEQCDDGFPPPTPSPSFLSDNDDCLATCQLNVCGDELLNSQGPQNIEVCDGRSLNNQTCISQGFQGGMLRCKEDCSGYDTSQCTPRPLPTPTATASVPSP
jgi:hypothetical protein